MPFSRIFQYNQGRPDQCFDVYRQAAETSLQQPRIAESAHGALLRAAVDQVESLNISSTGNYKKGAWILRRCFDEILSSEENELLFERQQQQQEQPSDSSSSVVLSTGGDNSEWQDGAAENTTIQEKAQALQDVGYILRSGVVVTDNELEDQVYKDTFPASAAVELLTQLGLAKTRDQAAAKCQLLQQGGLIVPVSSTTATTTSTDDETQPAFQDGTELYRFASDPELEQTLQSLSQEDSAYDENAQMLRLVVQLTLESDDADQRALPHGAPSRRRMNLRRSSVASPEYGQGVALAQLMASIEPHLQISDRKYHLKTYKSCFVGSEAVTAMVEHGLADAREPAVQQLHALLDAGLLHHVTRDHDFQDKHLFYRVTAASDIQVALDQLAAAGDASEEWTVQDRVQHIALVQRYKHAGAAGLNVREILNAFFACEDESGWDLVDLDNWRTNMKRWGFGRREQQDDAMVNKLSPLTANIDPENWMADEEWESPFGILAQIAIFDQVSRSAFRGTPDAFKWDQLAIKASKTAIEKGYFETAYQSTLNQFLILLPLEHSESWEDQKLGVHLLLKLLSTVAIQDEGLSDYEIVKRLEFSKRLTTAFLEHAQVIAKFRRYPHRNRAQGRTTSLEERIWLASDLVPRWAKSQTPGDSEQKKNLIQLPVIPLKRLTRR